MSICTYVRKSVIINYYICSVYRKVKKVLSTKLYDTYVELYVVELHRIAK